MRLRKALSDVHHAILVATDDYPPSVRWLYIAGWWISLSWKLPILFLYIGDDEGAEQTDWVPPTSEQIEEFGIYPLEKGNKK